MPTAFNFHIERRSETNAYCIRERFAQICTAITSEGNAERGRGTKWTERTCLLGIINRRQFWDAVRYVGPPGCAFSGFNPDERTT